MTPAMIRIIPVVETIRIQIIPAAETIQETTIPVQEMTGDDYVWRRR